MSKKAKGVKLTSLSPTFRFGKFFVRIVGCNNISISTVFIFSRKIVCAVLSFLKLYIRDIIRSKKVCFGDIAISEIFFRQSVSLSTIFHLSFREQFEFYVFYEASSIKNHVHQILSCSLRKIYMRCKIPIAYLRNFG